MKTILIIIFIAVSYFSFSQNCEKELIENIKNTFDSIYKAHYDEIYSVVDTISERYKLNKDSLNILCIPKINYKKDIRKDKVDTTKFFCYVNAKDMVLDQTFIYKDSIVYTRLIKKIYFDSLMYFRINKNDYILPKKLSLLNADLIFTISFINLYFLIKNNKLYVAEINRKYNDIKYYLASEYLSLYFKEHGLLMLTEAVFAKGPPPQKRTKIYYFFSYIFWKIKMLFN